MGKLPLTDEDKLVVRDDFISLTGTVSVITSNDEAPSDAD
jgi:hypothetical protein